MKFNRRLYKVEVTSSEDGFNVEEKVFMSYTDKEKVYYIDENNRERSIAINALNTYLPYRLVGDYVRPKASVFTFDKTKIPKYIETLKEVSIIELGYIIDSIGETLEACKKELKGELKNE